MDHVKLTHDKLSVDEVNECVLEDCCGAVSMFIGTTRDNFEGKKVVRLEYEAYEPMALKALRAVCAEVRARWPDVRHIALHHRLGAVGCREASVIVAASSAHRAAALAAVAHAADRIKATATIWKKEVYADEGAQWKENPESQPWPVVAEGEGEVQVSVTNEELRRRIQNFIDRKRDQVNLSNIHDFIPRGAGAGAGADEGDGEVCARVRAVFVKRSDSKGHLKVHKVFNDWGPQTHPVSATPPPAAAAPLPPGVAERAAHVERYLRLRPVGADVYARLKAMEDRIAYLDAISPEYAQFWKREPAPVAAEERAEYEFSSEDIARKIEQMEQEAA